MTRKLKVSSQFIEFTFLFQGEDAIEFANRVKREIALKGGLVDLVWDGNLKRTGVKKEWIAAQQEQFSRRLKVD